MGSKFQSALFIRGGAIGDFILTLPGIRLFREKNPEARIEVVGYTHLIELVHQRFYADRVRSIDHRSMAGFFAKDGELDPELGNYFSSFDVVVSFLYDPDSIFQENLKRAGVKKLVSTDGRPPTRIHAVEHWSEWLLQVGIPDEPGPPRVHANEWDRKEIDQHYPEIDGQFIAIHPGSGSPDKNWNKDRFVQLMDEVKKMGRRVILIQGPADDWMTEYFKGRQSDLEIHVCSGLRLPALGELIRRCGAFVGHDSGITHLAAAVGTPVVVLFGPTSPRLWAPRSSRGVCSLTHPDGLKGLEVSDVQKALVSILKEG